MNGLIPEQLYFTPIFKSLITQSGETSLTLTSLGPEKEERRFCIVPLSSIRFFYFVSISACCATTHAIPGSGGPHRTSLLQGIGTRRVRAVKSQFTLRQSDWPTNHSSTIGTFFYAGFSTLDLLLGPYGCLPTGSLKCLTSSQKCFIPSVLIS